MSCQGCMQACFLVIVVDYNNLSPQSVCCGEHTTHGGWLSYIIPTFFSGQRVVVQTQKKSSFYKVVPGTINTPSLIVKTVHRL